MSKAVAAPAIISSRDDRLKEEVVKFIPTTGSRGNMRCSVTIDGKIYKVDLVPGQKCKVIKVIADMLERKMQTAVQRMRNVPDGTDLEDRINSGQSPRGVKGGGRDVDPDSGPGVGFGEGPGGYEIIFYDR